MADSSNVSKASGQRTIGPIAIGGLGLSGLLAVWMGLEGWGTGAGVAETGEAFSTLSLAAVGLGALWWRSRRGHKFSEVTEPKIAGDRDSAVRAIEQLSVAIERLQTEFERDADAGDDPKQTKTPEAISARLNGPIEQRNALAHRCDAIDRAPLEIAIVGAPFVGKSAIASALATEFSTALDTAPVTWTKMTVRTARSQNAKPDGEANTTESLTESPDDVLHRAILADYALYTIAGDLTASERRNIEHLVNAGQTVFIIWNQREIQRTTDRDRVLSSVRYQLADLISADRILAVTIAANADALPSIAPLRELLQQQAIEVAPTLICQQIQRAARNAISDIQQVLNVLRRHRAEPVVRRHQWVAATATLANPIPSLDLLASGSIGAQLLFDLGRIYHRKVSLVRARAAFDAIAEMLLKLGLVELSTQAIAGFLKHHPVTFIAGSAVQGLSAAYLIHAIGQSAIVYLETQDLESFESDGRLRGLDPAEDDFAWDWSRFQAILTKTLAETRRTTVMAQWASQMAAAVGRSGKSVST